MTVIREDIEQKFYDVLKHQLNLQEFEQWLYVNDIESELPNGLYMNLISLNFQDKYVYNNLEKLLKPVVDFGRFEIQKLEYILNSIVTRDEKCARSIEMTYDLYCSGYNFLRRLGLTYGLLVSCPPAGNYLKTWDEITPDEQQELLSQLYPKVITDAKNALNWLKKGKIIIKSSVDELGNYEYEDLRNNEEVIQGDLPKK